MMVDMIWTMNPQQVIINIIVVVVVIIIIIIITITFITSKLWLTGTR